MTTETELRSALRARAADARTLDVEHLLAGLAGDVRPVRAVAGMSHGRRWAVAGVAAGAVALATVPVVLAAQGGTDRTAGPGGPAASTTAASPSVVSSASAPASAPASVASAPASTPAGSASASTSRAPNPNDPAAPFPLDASWIDVQDDPAAEVDPAAIVFSDDPIVAFYLRPHEQLSILPGGGTSKDSSDAPWHTAVQVYLPGGGFDPASIGTPTVVTVDGVDRQVGTLPKLLDVPGPDDVPSLLWQVGDAWVVLQIDTPAVPTSDQLAAAATRLDVHAG